MLSCAWWERSVHFCLVPCSECCQCNWIEWPWTRQQKSACERKHCTQTYYYFHRWWTSLSLGCQLETYPWPRPINSGSSGCNLDFAVFNTCQFNVISSKKTKHSPVISSTEAVGDNWACQTHGDSSKLVQFVMETSHVHSKYLIILIKQALFFNSKYSCQVFGWKLGLFSDLANFVLFLTVNLKACSQTSHFLWNTVFAISEAMV